MGMTIDEARTALGKERKYALHENKQAFDMAIDTMRKYQKIEQILKSLDDGEINYPQMTYYLREVLEDGNVL
jgi:hypothetical protein